MPNYFLYARKSTDVEDKQVRSIDDQLAVLRKLAKEENLNITAEFIEKQSAKKPGRPVFLDMLKRIENGEASGIICWKLDRLARNPIDGGQISWLLQKNVIQHIRTFERSYYPQDNVLIMSVEFGMANQYILDLRTNTKRGLMEKVKRGEYCSLAPIGYINDTRTKLVVVDKRKAKVIKAAYELYAENNSTLEQIGQFFSQNGILTRNKKPFSKVKVSWILSNPFYCGLFKYAGELYEGKHEAIIQKRFFDKVQKVLAERSKPQKQHQEPLSYCGLLNCANCGMMITAAIHHKKQKNGMVHNYIYYHCSKKSKSVICKEPLVREEQLDEQLSEILKQFQMPEDWAVKFQELSQKEQAIEIGKSKELIQTHEQQLNLINTKLQRLLTVYLEQDVDRNTYQQQKADLLHEKKSLEEKISEIKTQVCPWVKPLEEWLKDAQNATKTASSPSLLQKKLLLKKIFGLNLSLKNRQVQFVPQNQWVCLKTALEESKKNDASSVMVEMPGVKPGSKSYSLSNYSQD